MTNKIECFVNHNKNIVISDFRQARSIEIPSSESQEVIKTMIGCLVEILESGSEDEILQDKELG